MSSHHHDHRLPLARTAGLGALLLLALACGGGPDTGGLEPVAFYASFSGEWQADEHATDDVRDVLDARRPGGQAPGMVGGGGRGGGRRGGGMGGMGGRGGGGGVPPGGGAPPGGGGRLDAEAIRTARRLAGEVPERLALAVTDTTVSVTGLTGAPLLLPLDGDEVITSAGGSEMKVKAKWDGAILVLERSLGSVKIVDRLEPLAADERLLVTREIAMGRGGSVEVRFGYDRKSAEGTDPSAGRGAR